MLGVEVVHELLQNQFNNSCFNCSYSALISQKKDSNLVLEAGGLVLEGSRVFSSMRSCISPLYTPSFFFHPILEHEPVTFRVPLYLICTLCLLDCLYLEVDSLPGREFWLLGSGVRCLLGCGIIQPAYYEQHYGTFP